VLALGLPPAGAARKPEVALPAADPCADFAAYACSRSGTLAEPTAEAQQRVTLRKVLEQAAAAVDPDPATKAIRVFDAACRDTARIEAAGREPIGVLLNKVNLVRNPDTYLRYVGEFHAIGIEPLFRLRVAPDPEKPDVSAAWILPPVLGLPDPHAYVAADAASAGLRLEYQRHIQAMFEALGQTAELAAAGAERALRVETGLAKAVLASEARGDDRHWRKLTESALDQLTPGLHWQWYRQGAETKEIPELVVWDPDYLREIAETITQTRVEVHQAYMRWKVLEDSAPFLAAAFAGPRAQFLDKLGAPGETARADRCAAETLAAFPDAVGRRFAAQVLSPEAQRVAAGLVESIRAELVGSIEGVSWLSEAERTKARATLRAMTLQVGAPSAGAALPEPPAVAADQYAKNHFLAFHALFAADLAKAGKSIDRGEWRTSAATTAVVADPARNVLTVPAGALRPRYFDGAASPSANYSGLGALVAAEMVRALGLPAPGAPSTCLAEAARPFLSTAGSGTLDRSDLVAEVAGLATAQRAWSRSLAAAGGRAPDKAAQREFFRGYAGARCRRGAARSGLPSELRWLVPLAALPDVGRVFECASGSALGAKPACANWP